MQAAAYEASGAPIAPLALDPHQHRSRDGSHAKQTPRAVRIARQALPSRLLSKVSDGNDWCKILSLQFRLYPRQGLPLYLLRLPPPVLPTQHSSGPRNTAPFEQSSISHLRMTASLKTHYSLGSTHADERPDLSALAPAQWLRSNITWALYNRRNERTKSGSAELEHQRPVSSATTAPGRGGGVPR